MGIRIPHDVAFVNLFLDQADGKMAGVRQNHDIVGGVAVEILAGHLQHNKFGLPEVPTTTFVEGNWFDGATCPPVAAVRVQRSVGSPASAAAR
jgi:LacI family transcriptional regulator